MNSRQLTARLPQPVRQVGVVQLLGSRPMRFQDSTDEHNALSLGLPNRRFVQP